MSNSPKRLTAARLAGIPELEEAFSDTTDTKDIWDGGGVQPASRGRHVVLLQESLLAMGYSLPRYGADGIYGSETTAAVTQFQIDAGHPWPPGQKREHIGGIAGPNTMAHFDMFDPSGTVSSHARRETCVVARSVGFSESPDHQFAGFDATTSPPALVLGTTTRRRVRVDRVPADADVTFAVVDPTVAEIGITAEGIVVGGRTAGTTSILASSEREVLAELRVEVKTAREEVVNFFFMSDGSEPPFATVRDHAMAQILTLRLNRVFRRQANVHFTCGQVRDVVVPIVIGSAVERSHLPSMRMSAAPGQLNVLCVWDCEPGEYGPPQGIPDEREDAALPFLLILPDNDCGDGMTVPHGAGRYLGCNRSPQPEGLMSPCNAGVDRRRVSKHLADIVNP